MQYDDEQLTKEENIGKINDAYKNSKLRQRDEEFGYELHVIKEEEFNNHIKQLYFLMLENEIYLMQLKNVLSRTRYRVSTFMSSLDNSIALNKKHYEQLLNIDNGLKTNTSVEVKDKKYKFYNAKTSILNCCNNQNKLLRTLLLLMLLNNIKLNSLELNKMALEQVEILESVTNLM